MPFLIFQRSVILQPIDSNLYGFPSRTASHRRSIRDDENAHSRCIHAHAAHSGPRRCAPPAPLAHFTWVPQSSAPSSPTPTPFLEGLARNAVAMRSSTIKVLLAIRRCPLVMSEPVRRGRCMQSDDALQPRNPRALVRAIPISHQREECESFLSRTHSTASTASYHFSFLRLQIGDAKGSYNGIALLRGTVRDSRAWACMVGHCAGW